MIEVDRAELVQGMGLAGEPFHKGKRGVTLLSVEAWSDVCRQLKNTLPWHTRRANVLISGLDLGNLADRTLIIGEVQLVIHGETKPCGLMDQQFMGLREALVPNCRGGMHAEVVIGGVIEVGQHVQVR
jgi:MOSC domain-containing protein YiiM